MDDTEIKKRPCKGTIYKIQKGDTLYKIAKQFKIRVSDLMKANPFVNVYNLQIGEELCIPVKSVPSNDNFTYYVVKPNETLEQIIAKSKITYQDLLKYNPFIGELIIPAKTVIMLPKA